MSDVRNRMHRHRPAGHPVTAGGPPMVTPGRPPMVTPGRPPMVAPDRPPMVTPDRPPVRVSGCPALAAPGRRPAPASARPASPPRPSPPDRGGSQRRRLRNGLVFAGALSGVIAALVLAVPGLRAAIGAAHALSPGWLVLAVGLELGSCLGYVVAFALVFGERPRGLAARVAWSEMAFGAVVPAGGAGGIALGGWMLRQRGMTLARIAERSATLFWLTSAVNVVALTLAGLALAGGLSGPARPLLGLLPSAVGLGVLGLFAALPHAARRLPEGRVGTALRATAGTVTSTERLLVRPSWRLIGAIAYPGADIAVLWCCLAAIGVHPPIAAVVCAYFAGYLLNVLPIPGGIGVLDAGLVGALVLYHVPAAAAVTAVLLYHAIALWLPTIGGTIAFLSARRDLHPPAAEAPSRVPSRMS